MQLTTPLTFDDLAESNRFRWREWSNARLRVAAMNAFGDRTPFECFAMLYELERREMEATDGHTTTN